ncbi:HTH-type transcriptional regulator GltC [mine drainage metagenome]|uniref:HTH-type transcriptional regulator GltC n=1 Tax=mine drainage metagenome TaxID=410659 RepID=A0A1J5S6F8_9ZZZZ
MMRSVELRHLRYFSAVAKTLSFSRAAEKLHVVQPAVSRQIRDLEDELGTVLLDRNHAHVRLTDSGRLFLGHCDRVLAQIDRAIRSVRDAHDGAGGTLLICTDWRLPMDLLPSAVAAFRRRFPRVDVDLRESPMQDHINALRSRKAHLGFVPEEAIPPGADFGRLVVQRSEVMVVSPTTHPLASLSEVKLGNLRHETWICTESPDHSHRHFVTHSCRLAGFAPTFGRSASTLEGVLGRVSAGYGIALMPTAVTLPERLGLHAVRTDCPSFAICAVWNERENSALLRNFVDVLRGLLDRRSDAYGQGLAVQSAG